MAMKAIHLQDQAERKKKPDIKDMWIDIGATSRAEAEEIVSLGDVATYQSEFQPLMGDRASARGFDNKIGAFIVAEALCLLKQEGGLDPGVGVYAVATVQEEIGLRGARTASDSIAAQSGRAVDVDHATDTPGISETLHGALDIGGGPLRDMHTPVEVLSLEDVENGARLVAAYCRQVKPDTDFTPC